MKIISVIEWDDMSPAWRTSLIIDLFIGETMPRVITNQGDVRVTEIKDVVATVSGWQDPVLIYAENGRRYMVERADLRFE